MCHAPCSIVVSPGAPGAALGVAAAVMGRVTGVAPAVGPVGPVGPVDTVVGPVLGGARRAVVGVPGAVRVVRVVARMRCGAVGAGRPVGVMLRTIADACG